LLAKTDLGTNTMKPKDNPMDKTAGLNTRLQIMMPHKFLQNGIVLLVYSV